MFPRLARIVCAFALQLLVFFSACSDDAGPSPGSQGPVIDQAISLGGVPDQGADPSVVAIDVAGTGVCAGALLAPDVVVTARSCVDVLKGNPQCPAQGPQVVGPRSPSSLRVLVGDDLTTATERARGFNIVDLPGEQLCGGDIAVLLLDAAIDDRTPLLVRPTAAARGDHLRTAGYDRQQKLVRDHVTVAETSPAELLLNEAPCRSAPGSVAIDETTGEIVGVLSRAEPGCAAGGADVYTRIDVADSLIAFALSQAPTAVLAHAAKAKKGPIDMAANCTTGSDCAAGVCVIYAGSEYCSRTCGPSDKCPANFRCMQSQEGPMACVES